MNDAATLARLLARGETSAATLADAALSAIAARDGDLKAFIHVDADGARRAAEAADRRRAAGRPLGPLDGVPVAIKDNLAMAGTVTTGGHGRDGLVPDEADAHVVARLKAAGAVIVGKTNLHEGALGATTDNIHHGQCQNPLAAGYTPGGSSGGSAAAVAAGIVPIALGSDTMGSVRIPAAYCGLYGIKPSRGRIGRSGVLHLSPTLDVIGPIAASARDLATTLAALEGPDAADGDWVPPAARLMPPEGRGARPVIGLLSPADVALEPAIAAGLARATAALEAMGAEVRDVALGGLPLSKLRREGLLVLEAEAWMLLEGAIGATPARFGDDFVAMVRYAERMKAARLARAYDGLRVTAAAAVRALGEVDALLMPTTPQRAFPHGSEVPVNQADLTAIANVAGLPAVALPVPAEDGGLPASVQLVGPMWSDYRLIELAGALGAAVGAP
ncbi:amidase [Acuticoccus kandeliae]|uniref:amidase n=1 Tax=Acuticoccus kandeliae TaxID=2073160 RepID=UPI001300BE73|nr:amidase [Acuticoccus kandeliae]